MIYNYYLALPVTWKLNWKVKNISSFLGEEFSMIIVLMSLFRLFMVEPWQLGFLFHIRKCRVLAIYDILYISWWIWEINIRNSVHSLITLCTHFAFTTQNNKLTSKNECAINRSFLSKWPIAKCCWIGTYFVMPWDFWKIAIEDIHKI